MAAYPEASHLNSGALVCFKQATKIEISVMFQASNKKASERDKIKVSTSLKNAAAREFSPASQQQGCCIVVV
jgi:hypothetical protein